MESPWEFIGDAESQCTSDLTNHSLHFSKVPNWFTCTVFQKHWSKGENEKRAWSCVLRNAHVHCRKKTPQRDMEMRAGQERVWSHSVVSPGAVSEEGG